jgi:hypothetical protein
MAKSAAYPFVTRREIAARLASEPAFVKECASVLQARTEQRVAGSAPSGKPWGWMSSERVVAGRLTAKSKIGMLSVDDEAKLAKLVSRYSRQIADHFRSLALAENPGLSEAAEKFGVLPGGSTPSDISQGPRNPQERAERCHPSGERRPDDLEDNPDAEFELAPEVIDDDMVIDDGADSEPAQDDRCRDARWNSWRARPASELTRSRRRSTSPPRCWRQRCECWSRAGSSGSRASAGGRGTSSGDAWSLVFSQSSTPKSYLSSSTSSFEPRLTFRSSSRSRSICATSALLKAPLS